MSYCREDSPFAVKLAEDLRAAGANVWIDQLDINPGQPWDVTVEKALQSAGGIIVILSPASVDSPNVRDEVSLALGKNKRVIPILYRDCDAPIRLTRLQRIDFRTDYTRGLNALLNALGRHLQQPSSSDAVQVRSDLEIRWDPSEDGYVHKYFLPEQQENIQYRLCIVNTSARNLNGVNVKLSSLIPRRLDCVPCDLQLMNDNPVPGEPHLKTFPLSPYGGSRFIDLLLQWPNGSQFWVLHTVPRQPLKIPAEPYVMTISVTAENAAPATKHFVLIKEGAIWTMRAVNEVRKTSATQAVNPSRFGKI
jgi:hypothetical protein